MSPNATTWDGSNSSATMISGPSRGFTAPGRGTFDRCELSRTTTSRTSLSRSRRYSSLVRAKSDVYSLTNRCRAACTVSRSLLIQVRIFSEKEASRRIDSCTPKMAASSCPPAFALWIAGRASPTRRVREPPRTEPARPSPLGLRGVGCQDPRKSHGYSRRFRQRRPVIRGFLFACCAM